MSGIKFASRRIQHIVVDEHLIPCGDKININVICDVKIAVHSQETRK